MCKVPVWIPSGVKKVCLQVGGRYLNHHSFQYNVNAVVIAWACVMGAQRKSEAWQRRYP